LRAAARGCFGSGVGDAARSSRMMQAVNGLEAAESEVCVDLRGRDIGVAEHHLHAAQIGAVLDHVRGTTVAQAVWTGGVIGALDQAPDPLARERHAAEREKKLGTVLCCCPFLANCADALKVRAAFAEVLLECPDRGAAEGDDALLIAFAAHLRAAGIEREVANGKTSDLGDAEAAGVEKLKDGAVAQSGGLGLGMRGGEGSALEHLGDFRLGEGFGQNFPGFGRFDVDGGVVMDAAIEKEPFVEAAETTELARGGTRIDGVGAEVIEEGGDVGLDGGDEDGVAVFKELGEDAQIAEVGLAGERAKSFFYAKIAGVVV